MGRNKSAWKDGWKHGAVDFWMNIATASWAGADIPLTSAVRDTTVLDETDTLLVRTRTRKV